MAELYLAKDTKRDRLVVIKRILPYLAQEREFVQMFLDEARIASQLHHPHIITVYELGHLEGSIFIAMEYVEGVDLRKIFNEEQKRGGVVPLNITAWLTSKLCDGLHYAHNAKGADGKPLQIIHRDVSPQNLMVGYQGQVKLVDFGIAKAGAFMERSKPGVIKGKFLYLSPEQLSQERIDHRADIFALGTMMYELSTGKSPFYKATTEAVIYAIRAEEPPPPHLMRRDFPVSLSKIIMRCLAKDRNKRYQQAGEVRHDLEGWMRAEGPTSVADVKGYVARLFGGDDERTSLFIPANARGPNDRMTDRHAVPASKPAAAGLIRAPPTDPDRTVRGPPAGEPTHTGEMTRPLSRPALEAEPTKSIVTNSTVTTPVGRKPTPQPMKAVTGARPAVAPPQRATGQVPARAAPQEPENRTQTARPQDLAKAFTTAPPVRRHSAEGLQAAGSGETEDSTALSTSSQIVTADLIPSPSQPSQPSVKTPVTVENKPARSGPGQARLPEGLRATRQPGEPPPGLRRMSHGDQNGVPRAPTSGAVRPEAATLQQRGNSPASRVDNPAARAGAVPTREAGHGRKPTRADAGALEVSQPHGRPERPSPPVPSNLPPEPSTREERPRRAPTRRSMEDIGPILDRAIPAALERRPSATYDSEAMQGTMDLPGTELGDDAQDFVPSQRMEPLELEQDEAPPDPEQEPESTEAPLDDEDDRPGIAERPMLVAALVFVVVLVLGLGGLAIFRYRQGKAQPVPVATTKPDKPDEVKKGDKPDEVPAPKSGTPSNAPAPVPAPQVDETQTVMVRFVAPSGTKLIDQRDGTQLNPNTPYRWNAGRHPVVYRCPKKGRLQTPDVTYNVEVKQAVADQTFTISCK